jgi:hypothetical protein
MASNAQLHDVYAQDLDIFLGLLLVRPGTLDLVYDVKSLCRTTKDGMLAIQPGLTNIIRITIYNDME